MTDLQNEQSLFTPLQFLKGVGTKRAAVLARLGLHTAADLVFFFPRDYQDFGDLVEIEDLQADELASVKGTIVDIEQRPARTGKTTLFALLERGSMHLRGIWFNPMYVASKLAVGQEVIFQGKPKLSGMRWEMVHPKVTPVDAGIDVEHSAILPVYRLTEGITQPQIREIVWQAVEKYAPDLDDVLPEDFRAQRELLDITAAIRNIHRPDDQNLATQARRRLVFQELLVLQLALFLRKQQLAKSAAAPRLVLDGKIRARILRRFPFEPTESQRTAIDEIAADMSRDIPMNRLLHGEVGSGKTMVATFALLLTVAHGHRAVIMAPTELLAQQHRRFLHELLDTSRVRIGVWTGSLSTREKKELKSQIESGNIDIVVGTHALIHSDFQVPKLGLVVIDEQHKFGVRQRAALRQMGAAPHYLVMTATPIPRTIAMTVFGDLDVSTIKRQHQFGTQVHTYRGAADQKQKWWDFYAEKLREGRQGYVIAPLVEGDDQSEHASVEQLYEALANGPLESFRLDYVHGRQQWHEKQAAMQRFESGETQVLIATSIVEVGINVPNATLMTIESADKFGLSQLHQLRGRISRGSHPGYVCAFPGNEQAESHQRLDAFSQCNDGFELAELDLKFRGPGNFFGTDQHGIPPLRIADLLRDSKLLQMARRDAHDLVLDSQLHSDARFSQLRKMVVKRYGNSLEIADVG